MDKVKTQKKNIKRFLKSTDLSLSAVEGLIKVFEKVLNRL